MRRNLSPFVVGLILLASIVVTSVECRQKRGLELTSAHQLISDNRLSSIVQPLSYSIDLRPNAEFDAFEGLVRLNISAQTPQTSVILHAHSDLIIDASNVSLRDVETNEQIGILAITRKAKKSILSIRLNGTINENRIYELRIAYSGSIWTTVEGLFRGQYVDMDTGEKKTYLATQMRPNNARRVFPCFDEPEYKTPFTVSISRPKTHHTLFNTLQERTVEMEENKDFVVDHFVTTDRMSTFTLGFLTSNLSSESYRSEIDDPNIPAIRFYFRNGLKDDLGPARAHLIYILKSISKYFGLSYPLGKLDIVALPGFSGLKPIDNWSLLIFKESDLLNKNFYLLSQEIIYQWFGAWITPTWWSDAHINKAVVGFLAASTILEIDNGLEFDGKWPMTSLYSIYYEFSKRYPHSRITGLKQETTCTKTELVLRMINYTIGADTFRDGLRQLFDNKTSDLFYGDNVWNKLTDAAHRAKTLPLDMSINEIVNSWITKDRLPVVTITRDYEARTAVASQKVYLRERPHDVPEQDKMLWWIPLILVKQNDLQFNNATPYVWLAKKREVTMKDMPASDQFVIVNPEEIGPFPVNYDTTNWNLLATFLQTKEGRERIPIYTRAKLLHDAWNLAYAGDLSFATALNMTLFMKYEREHLVWNPVFTLIDHIGNHIDMSTVHKKFETYVGTLLTPLYEELGPFAVENEEKWKDSLRTLSRLFLCRAGYRPCIEEAQAAYKKWMASDEPDEGNPVANQYICPVFKWGTQEEWEFGLQRVINFPASRKQSERTYLLKCLVGCPMQAAKIERMLNLTILEENKNFTENDIFLEFNMLSSGSSGYISLFNFLSNNWDVIRERFENKTNLWDNLISSATGVFTTQEGYDMVSKLYTQRKGEFGSAQHIIEKSLRNIKEESKWSAENLPVIERWLDDYLKTTNDSSDKKFLMG